MDLERFFAKFEHEFPAHTIARPNWLYRHKRTRRFFDPCPDVRGMTAMRNLKLLKLAYSCLGETEAYLEVGTRQGKTLIAAMLGNRPRRTIACDNFSEFGLPDSSERLQRNLRSYGLIDRVEFHNADFRRVLTHEVIQDAVGVYFYDAAHDEESQYEGIRLGESLLADRALVVVDDWRVDRGSGFFAKEGTERALRESRNRWKLQYELPARKNRDHELWWNGVAVFSFERKAR
jgi:predicted O-methyltransferase YrrM